MQYGNTFSHSLYNKMLFRDDMVLVAQYYVMAILGIYIFLYLYI